MANPIPFRRQSSRRSGPTPQDTARRPAVGRLGRGDWVRAGQEVLREAGISGLKLAALTARLGVSTGSFYYHFTDFEEYLGAVAESFSAERVQGLIDRTKAGTSDPLTQIRRLAKLSLEDKTFELDKAMRIWATMDRRAAATVSRSEKAVLAFLTQAFEALGFVHEEATQRARILLSANIARLLTVDGKSRRRFFKRTLEILTDPDKR
jgi:AcrR family transcriptional regulator